MPKKEKFPYQVCKPCWELHYCPYGALVEKFPLVEGSVTREHVTYAKKRHKQALSSLKSGIQDKNVFFGALDDIEYFDPANWEMLSRYESADLECRVYGHVCPVFFCAESATETKKQRRVGRHIPREAMFQVARRDDYTCRLCQSRVPDYDIHFDHIIPISKGGRTEVQNLRLLCSKCNRKKSASLDEILEPKRS